MTERVFTIKEVAKFLQISENALRLHLFRGTGPPARRMSKGRIIILQSELFEWLSRMEYVSRKHLHGVRDGKVIDPELTIVDDPEGVE